MFCRGLTLFMVEGLVWYQLHHHSWMSGSPLSVFNLKFTYYECLFIYSVATCSSFSLKYVCVPFLYHFSPMFSAFSY